MSARPRRNTLTAQAVTAPPFPTPTALHPSAQGCEARATLGVFAKCTQPQRGCINSSPMEVRCNPVGVDTFWGTIPRVAPQTAQPWAERWNPVGIQERATKGATA